MRSEQRLRSPNIYGDGAVIRDVLSLRGSVRPGNSGGPVVSSGGDVVGVVFAASLTDSDTGYALTAEQVAAGRDPRRRRDRVRRHPGLRGIGPPLVEEGLGPSRGPVTKPGDRSAHPLTGFRDRR